VRIISGTHKGRRITPDKKFSARPTTDFAKENLFNIISNWYDIDELNILDLFSGTGGISYEFASRGAISVISVEKNIAHQAFIKKNIIDLNFKNIRSVKADVFKFVNSCKNKFDLIFADPPYDLPNIDTIPDAILNKDLLQKDGILIVEHSRETDFSAHPLFTEKREYGSVNFSIFAAE
jgi:16S rRNA (guanine(966)-N(2))-methyltransferase RsmD